MSNKTKTTSSSKHNKTSPSPSKNNDKQKDQSSPTFSPRKGVVDLALDSNSIENNQSDPIVKQLDEVQEEMKELDNQPNEANEEAETKISYRKKGKNTLFQPDDLYSLDQTDASYEWDEANQRQDDTPTEEEQAMQTEMVEFYVKLIQYVATAPEGELKIEDAEDMLGFIRTVALDDHRPLFQLGCIPAIYNVMDRAEGFVELQVNCCQALRHLTSSTSGEVYCLQQGMVAKLVEALTKHPKEDELQTIVLCGLAELSCSELGQEKMLEIEAHKVVLQALKSTGITDVDQRRWACAALAFMADDSEKGQQAMSDKGGLRAVFGCMANEGKEDADAGVCQLAMLAANRILCLPLARESVFKDVEGEWSKESLETVLQCMTTHHDNQVVQEHGCKVLQALCAGSSTEHRQTELDMIRATTAEEVLHKTIATFPQDLGLCSTAEGVLASLSDGYLKSMYYFSLHAFRDLKLWTTGSNPNGDDAFKTKTAA